MQTTFLRILAFCLVIALGLPARGEEPASPAPPTDEAALKAPPETTPSAPPESATAPAVEGTSPAPEAPKNVLTKAPVLKRFIDAPYPAEAQKEGVSGSVVMEIDIGADGKVARAVVTQGAGHGFDEAALEAVKQFEFEPAEIDHVPAAVRVTYKYDFVLRPPPPPEPVAGEEKPKPGIVNFEGQLVERGTRAPIRNGGLLLTKDGQTYEQPADEEGRFQFKDLPPGKYEVRALAPNFEPYLISEEVQEGQVTTAKFFMRRKTDEFTTTIRAPREKKEIARRTLTMEEIQKIPGTQGDAIRVVQNLPGVARTPLGLGPLIVRGGRPGDTRTYVDGMMVPVLFHFLGLRAVINSDFLDTLDFYPGNPPSRYGRSLSGAVDINTRSGKRDRYRGYLDVSLLEATAFAEGPLTSKGSFMASVRRSYIDAVLPLVFKIINNNVADFQVARYWDYQLKTDFDFGRDSLSFFLFGSNDRLALMLQNASSFSTEPRSNLSTEIGFHRFNAGWKRKLASNAQNRLNLTVGTGDTTNSFGNDLYGNLTLHTLFIRDDLTWNVHPKLQMNFGADVIGVNFLYALQGPPIPVPGQIFNPVLGDNLAAAKDSGYTIQPATFVEAVYKPFERLKLIPSLRLDYDSLINRAWVDPRLTAMVDVSPTVTLKAAVGQYHQPPSPEKLTKTFGNPNLHEEGSTQYAVGVDWRPGELWDIDMQVYYKDLFDQVPNGLEFMNASSDLQGGLTNNGSGRAYGVELLLRRQPGKSIFGWIAVSLGRVERRLADDQPFMQGLANQRFNVIGVVSYKSPWGFDFGLRSQLTDGNPRSEFIGGVYNADADRYIPIPNPERRTSRLPPYFQVDFRIDRKFVFERWILNTYLDILHVSYLARRNVEGANPNYNYTQTRPFYGIPIFPAFGVRGEF